MGEFRSTSEKRSDKSYKTTNVKIVIKITKNLRTKKTELLTMIPL